MNDFVRFHPPACSGDSTMKVRIGLSGICRSSPGKDRLDFVTRGKDLRISANTVGYRGGF
jgi:hypothetical protein